MSDGPFLIDQALVLVAVEDKNNGDLEIEFDSGEEYVGKAIVLTIKVVDAETREKRLIDLIIPRAIGPELLVNLLTDEQWDAVCSA